MINMVKAGVLYFFAVLLAGSLLGTVRVFWLEPLAGEIAATVLELPFILTFSWIVCTRIIEWCAIPQHFFQRLGMGVLAFVLLLMSEYGLALLIYDQSLDVFQQELLTTNGTIGLIGQAFFAFFPILEVNVSLVRGDLAERNTR